MAPGSICSEPLFIINSSPSPPYDPEQENMAPIPLPEGHLNFQDGINWVSDIIEIEECDTEWLIDAEFICKAITDIMTEKDWIYSFILRNLLTTATFYRGSKIDVPIDFEQYLSFYMPFPVTPIFNPTRPSLIQLYAPTMHPIVVNGYLNPENLQMHLRGNLYDTIQQLGSVHCSSGVQYKLTYRSHEIGDQGFVHEILAFEQREYGMPCVISFVFLPAIQFNIAEFPLPSYVSLGPPWNHCNGISYWLALLQVYPPYDYKSFCPYVPRMQLIHDERMLKYRNALRLLVKIGIGNEIPNISDIFILKGLHFFRLRYSTSCDCNLSLATLFIELLNIHSDIMVNDALQKLVTFGAYQQTWLRNAQRLEYLSRRVSMFYYINCIHFDHLKQLFGII